MKAPQQQMEIQFHENVDIQFPAKCACCLQPTTDTKVSYRHTVGFGLLESTTKTKKLWVPDCKPCQDHVDWTEGGGFFGLILSIPVNAFIWGLLVALIVFVWQAAHTWAYENERLSTSIGIATLVVLVAFLT